MIANNRLHTLLLVLILVTGVSLVAMMATGARGGPLDPPGPPASTDGVRDAGTPISSIPYRILQPGRYYLTRNVTGPGNNNGIEISAPNVTLDLNGFTIDGVDKLGTGILATGGGTDVSVENGAVTRYTNGIDLAQASVGRVSNVRVYSLDTSVGIGISPPTRGLLEDCGVFIVGRGVQLNNSSVMRDCLISFTFNGGVSIVGINATVMDSSITGVGGGYGILVQNAHATVRNNVFEDNGLRDIRVEYPIAQITDNAVHCPESVTQSAPFLMDAPMGSEPHANIPRIASGFC